ncbi:MAG: DNA helicase [Rhodocyclaceae bacterium]|nr:MAG: DNA helicase [Rhodocyclaceae bacterium]
MAMALIGPDQSHANQYLAAERFVTWLEQQVLTSARGDNDQTSAGDPTGLYWLGRLGPKDFVTRPDERGDRLEPCAIGIRVRPAASGPWQFNVTVKFCLWTRHRLPKDDTSQLRWTYEKLPYISVTVPINTQDAPEDQIFAKDVFSTELAGVANGASLSAEIRTRITGRHPRSRALEITFVNTSQQDPDYCDGRFFEASVEIEGLAHTPFELESLPDSFRFNRKVPAYGVNCGVEVVGSVLRTSDSPAATRYRPNFWPSQETQPDLSFEGLAKDPRPSANKIVTIFQQWMNNVWSEKTLAQRAKLEGWTKEMADEASSARTECLEELRRLIRGAELLSTNENLRRSFQLMNRAMKISAHGRYSTWRPFQFAFLLSNLECLISPDEESEIVDIVWFATGGGKTETYLGLIVTAAFLDRIRGKITGITAWSRFPLRMLSLQQTQRFANALAGAEMIRNEEEIAGDPFSLGFLVGGSSTPNRIKKESKNPNEDALKIAERENPFLLLDECPFCRQKTIGTSFDRKYWRLNHSCSNKACFTQGEPLPIYVVDDEIWRFLPTIVIGTLDKAANIARHPGMRGLLGNPKAMCSKAGHGFIYAKRKDFPNGCLVPDCKADIAALPMAAELFPSSFRLQDELHLLRDSLGAVDSHYECALDGIQQSISGTKPKILASSATLTGYQKQVDVLYRRMARVFPQQPPKDGEGFWTANSPDLMRRYVALAPRRLTVEFVVDKLIVTLQKAVRRLTDNPVDLCKDLNIDPSHAPFLVNLYGTNVVYGNTLQDIDAVVRSSETQYTELSPLPNVATLTGRTDFEEIRETLGRLESPEPDFSDRLHIVAASSMMSHGVDIDRLNIMIMLAFPLGVAEFIQATARVGRKWPGLVIVVPKMTRERDASVYRAFPEFITHGDRFVEPIPITRKSRRILERTVAGLELARLTLIHEPSSDTALTTIRSLNAFIKDNPQTLTEDEAAICADLGLEAEDEFMRAQLKSWFVTFNRNLGAPPSNTHFPSQLSPTGDPMTSLRDVEEQVYIRGNSVK